MLETYILEIIFGLILLPLYGMVWKMNGDVKELKAQIDRGILKLSEEHEGHDNKLTVAVTGLTEEVRNHISEERSEAELNKLHRQDTRDIRDLLLKQTK